MSTAQDNNARSWRRLSYLPPTLGLVLDADARGAALLTVLSAGMGLFAVADVHVLRRLIETAQQVVEGNASLGAGLLWGLVLALLALLQAAVLYGRDMLARHHQEVLAAFVEERCLQQAQSMPLEWFEHNEHYDLLHRVRGRTVGRLGHTMSFLWESLSLFVALMSLLLYLGQFHWGLPVLLAIGTTPGVLLRERLLSQRYLMEHAQTPQERRFEVYTGLMTGREAAAEIRLFSLGRWLLGQAGELRSGLHAERLQLAAHEARRTVVSDGLNGVVHILAIGLSVSLLVNGHISIGAAAALFAAIESFQVNYADLIWGVSLLNNDLRYLQDFFALMDTPRVDLKAGRRLEHVITEPIVMESVSFTYPGAARPALSNIDLSIRPGERIALAGENGAGKTTLVKLLMGLYRPTSGRIVVDGNDLNEIALTDWYTKFGGVFQSFLRYQTTVRENITFGWLEGANDEARLETVLTRSGAQEAVTALPRGLDTPLDKEFHAGAELSVGQWQKLAIARAYFRPAEILILDEPASALDAKAEAAVYRHFADMAQENTAILISHRLASCQIADRILVLREGRLIEQGTHAALLSADGEYAELYRLQATSYR